MRKQSIHERFWSKVEKRGPDECWPWHGCICHGKYGWFRIKGRNWSAHSAAFMLYFGEYDLALDVCHKCDNPPCCNPNHLFLGTRSENIRDAIKKGRWKNPVPQPGEKNPQHILTEYEVKQIRRIHASGGISQRELARAYGVNFRTINYILSRKLWNHIT